MEPGRRRSSEVGRSSGAGRRRSFTGHSRKTSAHSVNIRDGDGRLKDLSYERYRTNGFYSILKPFHSISPFGCVMLILILGAVVYILSYLKLTDGVYRILPVEDNASIKRLNYKKDVYIRDPLGIATSKAGGPKIYVYELPPELQFSQQYFNPVGANPLYDPTWSFFSGYGVREGVHESVRNTGQFNLGIILRDRILNYEEECLNLNKLICFLFQ